MPLQDSFCECPGFKLHTDIVLNADIESIEYTNKKVKVTFNDGLGNPKRFARD